MHKTNRQDVKELVCAMCVMIVPFTIRDGWELYDTEAVVDGRELRFITYRTDEDMEHSMEYPRTQGRKEVESLFNRFASKQFNCEEDTRREFAEVLKRHRDSAYVPMIEVVPIEVKSKYGKRGRPRKDWVPEVRNKYGSMSNWCSMMTGHRNSRRTVASTC